MKLDDAYTRMIEARRNFRALGITLICVSLVTTTVAHIMGSEAVRASGFTMFCLGLYSCSLADFQNRLARLQAALDMKRLALDQRKGRIVHVASGDEVLAHSDATLRFHTSCKFEVIK